MNLNDLDIGDSVQPKNLNDLELGAAGPTNLDDLSPSPVEAKEPGFIPSVERGFRGTAAGLAVLGANAQQYQADYLNEVLKGGDPTKLRKEKYPAIPVEMWNLDANAAKIYLEHRLKGAARGAALAVENIQKQQEIPQEPGYAAFGKAKGLKEIGSVIADNPVSFFKGLLGESMGASALSVPAAAVGGFVGGPAGLAVGAGIGSMGTEYANNIVEVLNDMKVNLKDPQKVLEALRTPEFTEKAQKKIPRAIVIGLFDAMGARVGAGKALSTNVIKNIGAKSAVESATGMGGEIAGSAAEGKVANLNDVIAEGLGGLPGAFVDMATGKITEKITEKIKQVKTKKANDLKTKLEAIVKEIEERKAIAAMGPPLPPNQPPYTPPPPQQPVQGQMAANEKLLDAPPVADAPKPSIAPQTDTIDLAKATKDHNDFLDLIQGGVTISQAALFWRERAPSRALKALYNDLYKVITKLENLGMSSDIYMQSNKEINESFNREENAPGMIQAWADVSPEDGMSIAFNEQLKANRYYVVAAHEMVHNATMMQMRALLDSKELRDRNPDQAKALEHLQAIHKKLQKIALDTDSKKLPELVRAWKEGRNNSLDNEYELVAWALTSKKMQDWLQSIPADANYGIPVKTAFSDFLDGIRRLFGWKRGQGQTLERIYGIYDTLTDESFLDDAYQVSKDLESWSSLPSLANDDTPTSVDIDDINTALATAEKVQKEAEIMNGIYDGKKPYTAMWQRLLAKPFEGQRLRLSNEMVDSILGGAYNNPVKDTPEAPWVLLKKEGESPILVPLFDNRELFNRIDKNYPNVRIMTPFEAHYYLDTGESTREAYASWLKEDQQRQLLRKMNALPWDADVKTKEHIQRGEEFLDETDVEIAKEKLLKEGQDLKQNVTDYLTGGAVTKAVMTNNPVIKWLRYAIGRAQRAQAIMTASRISPLNNLWKRMTNDEKVLTMQTLILGDAAQFEVTPDMLAKHGFSAIQIKFIETAYETNQFLYDYWNNMRHRVGLKPVAYRPGHFPGKFLGNYKQVATIDGKVVGVITSNSEIGLGRNVKHMKSLFPGLELGPIERSSLTQTPVGEVNLWDAYEQVSHILGPNKDATTQAFQDEMQKQAVQEQRNLYGFQVHELAKKGVFGAEGNKPWQSDLANANDAFRMFVQYIEQGIMHHEMIPVLSDMNRLITDPRMRKERPKTVIYMESLYRHLTRRAPPGVGESSRIGKVLHSIGTGVDTTIDGMLQITGIFGYGPKQYRQHMSIARSVFSTMTMGVGNLAFTALQISQLPIFAGPMAQHFRDMYDIPLTTARATHVSTVLALNNYFLQKWQPGAAKWMPKALTGGSELEMAMKYAEDNNLVNFSDIDRAVEAARSPAGAKVDFALNFNQRIAESTTRPYAFLWFFQIARAGGAPMQVALQQAKNATQFVMVPYRSEDRPMVYNALGSLGTAMGQLKTFAHSAVAQPAYWTKNVLFRRGNRPVKPFLLSLLFIVALMGIEAAPGFDMLDELFKFIHAKAYGEPKSLREWALEKDMPEWLSKGGASVYTGIDFNARLRTPQFVNTQSLLGNFPAINYFTDIGKAVNEYYNKPWNQQAKANLGYKTLPNTIWLKGFAAEYLYTKNTDRGKYLYSQKGESRHSLSDRDILLRKWGVRSLNETRHSEWLTEGREDTSMQEKQRKRLEDDLVDMWVSGAMNTAEYDNKLRQYLEYGDDNTEQRISQLGEKKIMDSNTPEFERAVGSKNDARSARVERNYNYKRW